MQSRFGDFVFDPEERALRKGGAPVRLSPKAFRLLEVLISRRPAAVPKQELYDALWPDTFVEEANLKNLVVELRAALGDDSRSPLFVRTVPRYGYGFAGEANASPFRLLHGREMFSLSEGQYVIGRADSANITIDSMLISRRHAKVTISGSQASVEDLGSKNGTLVNGRSIEGRETLHDGDEITLADDVVLLFRAPRAGDTTVTAPPSRKSR